MNGHSGDIVDDTDEVGEYDHVLTVFHASPLVSIDGEGSITPLDVSSLDREHQQLTGGVLEQEVKIRIDHKICTPNSFQTFLESGGRILHFACHATKGNVYLEQDKGSAKVVPISELQEWIQKGNLDLVVIADSDPAMALLEAFEGVPHVVCCPVVKHKLDEAALEFCKAFYKSLANLETVRNAFVDASKAVQDSTHLSYTGGRQATAKYRLLPEGGDHDVVVCQKQDDSNKLAALVLPPMKILPQPPPVFVGRQTNVYQLLQDLEEARLVRITGGMGAASIVKSACQYMVHRRDEFMHEIIWLPPRLGQLDGTTSLCLRVFESVVNLELPLQDDLITLVDILKKRKVLLVCDVREWDDSKDVFHGLMDFLDELFDLAPDTKAIVIQEATDTVPIYISSIYVEKSIQVKPLGYASTVGLFGLLCPHVAKRTVGSIASLYDLTTLLVPAAGYVGNANLKLTIVKIYKLLGSGNPSLIRELAVSMTNEEYESLVQVGRLRLKLSRLYQKQIEMTFPTRYSLDTHLAELSAAIEDARKDRKMSELEIFEAKFSEAGSRRNELPSVDTMLTKRKALNTELKLAKLSSRSEETKRIPGEILKLEKMIKKEREAMIDDGEDWIRLNYVEYPRGISRRTLENRYTAKEHLLLDARKTKDYRLVRELEFPLKELRECRPLLLQKSEWTQRRERLSEEIKEAEISGNVDLIVRLNDQVEEIETRLEDEESEVDAARISEDLFLSLDAFLRYTGDESVADIPVFEDFASRAEANECMAQIKEKAETSSDAMDMQQFNTLLGLYKEVCGITNAKFPSLEALLLERQGLKLEMTLVFSDDQEIIKDYDVDIEAVEVRIVQERSLLGPDQYYGVYREFYFRGITRALVDKRIEQLKSSLDEANDKENVFDMAELETRVAELVKHQDRLPSSSEFAALIERTKQDLEQLSRRPGNETKKKLMELAIRDLQKRKDAEDMPNDRTQADIADDLLIFEQDYFYPPMSDGFAELKDEDQVGQNYARRDDLSTVDEISEEDYPTSSDDE